MSLPRLVPTALQLVLLLSMAWLSPAAEACTAPPTPLQFFALQASLLPPEGALDVALDEVFLVAGRGWDTGKLTGIDDTFWSRVSVTVTDVRSGVPVPGRTQVWQPEAWWDPEWPTSAVITWRPDGLLQPNRRYQLVATLQQQVPRPEGAEDSTELVRSFTTGTRSMAPLELTGDLSVALTQVERDKLECNPWGCGCSVAGREPWSRVDLQLPGVQGGTPGHYRFELWVTSDTPFRFDESHLDQRQEVIWPALNRIIDGAPTAISFEVPKHPKGENYRPCFSWRVKDAAGATREGGAVCFQRTVPMLTAEPEPEPESEPLVDDDSSVSGCSAGPGSGGASLLSLLGVLAVMRELRTRRAAEEESPISRRARRVS